MTRILALILWADEKIPGFALVLIALLIGGSLGAADRLTSFPVEYEYVSGSVHDVQVDIKSNAWSGTMGNCRLTLKTKSGQKTISPYYRDCYQVSNGDIVVYRRKEFGDWKLQ